MISYPKFESYTPMLRIPDVIKQGEQYKNYKVYTSKQTFHINRYESTKMTV